MRLPLLSERLGALESCAFCPKLCRAACPVSAADGRESTTPWGKMTQAYLLVKEGLPLTTELASTAWACTACGACRERCDLRNDVASTLLDARADYWAAGAAPISVVEAYERENTSFEARRANVLSVVEEARRLGVMIDERSPVRVLLPDVDFDSCDKRMSVEALRVVAHFARQPIGVSTLGSGQFYFSAGAREAFRKSAHALTSSLQDVGTLVVIDADAVQTIMQRYETRPTQCRVMHLSSWLRTMLPLLPQLRADHPFVKSAIRLHDSCALVRGLGESEAPRDVLSRVTGKAPLEFDRNRLQSVCSGGGALLPVTDPATAQRIASYRAFMHESLGAGTIVTNCHMSTIQLQKAGAAVRHLLEIVFAAIEQTDVR